MHELKRTVPHRSAFLLLLALQALCALISGPILSYNSQSVFQHITDNAPLLPTLLLFAGCMAAGILLKWAAALLRFSCEKKLCFTIQDGLIQRVLDSDTFSGSNPKELLHQIYQQAEEYCQADCQFYVTAASSLALIAGSSCYLILVNPWLFVSCGAVLGLLFLFSKGKSADIQTLQANYMQEGNRLSAIQWEHIVNREVSPLLNPSRLFQPDRDQTEKLYAATLAMDRHMFPHAYISMFGATLASVAVVLFGCILCQTSGLEVSALFGTALLIPGTTGAVLGLPNLYNQYQQIKGMEQALDSIHQIPPYSREGREPVQLPLSSITANRLSLSYGTKQVVTDASFVLEPGTVSVLTGASGCGKSTLLRSLCMLLPTSGGQIRYGDQPLDRLDRQSLWKQICYLPQTPSILPLSLQQNILGERAVPDGYQQLIQLFGIGELAERQQLDLSKLSSGERQKIALLKMLFSGKPVWLLDEPTSALDPDSEKTVLEALYRAAHQQGRIVLMISHRPETIQTADAVYRLENGVLCEGKVTA